MLARIVHKRRAFVRNPFSGRFVQGTMQDIRYAVRSLRKQPIFTLVAVLTLTLGIGANTAIFSLLYQILLRPLPYANAERLVFVWNTYPLMGLQQASVSIPDYLDRKTQAPAIEDATLFTGGAATLAEGGQPEQLRTLAVTPSFFTTLGRQPFLGRGFTEEEAKPEADKFAILTHALWSSRFGRDRSIVGRDIRLNGERLPRRRRPARGLRPAVARRRAPGAVRVHAAADVRQRARQRVQQDDRAAPPRRDDRSAERADQDDRRSQQRSAARRARSSRSRAASAASPSACAISWSATCARRC